MPTVIEVKGLNELIGQMDKYPQELRAVMYVGVEASLLVLNESVPPYPDRESDYDRTGTLGRTLGSSEGGGTAGQASIHEIRPLGSGFEGRFGTNLDYAPYVIGDDEQAWMHQGIWWTISDVAERASAKIERIWQDIGEKLAAFLERGR